MGTMTVARRFQKPIYVAGNYVAKGVNFDSTSLTIASLSMTDSQYFSFSAWVRKAENATSSNFVFMGDVRANDTIEFDWTGNGNLNFFCLPQLTGGIQSVQPIVNNLGPKWHHVIGTLDLGSPRRGKMLINGVDYGGFTQSGSPTATVFVLNGKEFTIGRAGSPGSFDLFGDLADLWIAPTVNLLDSNGDIPASTLSKFYNVGGGPVYLGANGELPTGTAPLMFFSGDNSTFATNMGTGGSFTLSGPLANTPGIVHA
jgi:hypothetical protein